MSRSKRKRKRNILDNYVRTTAKYPCPVCGRPDWCLMHKNGGYVICSREKSGKPVGYAGWRHYVEGDRPMPKPSEATHVYLTSKEVSAYLHSVTNARNVHMLSSIGKSLGLTLESLLMMQTTYDQDKAVAVFPMFNERKLPTGCRFRRSDERKYSLTGGREGVFLSRRFGTDRMLWITEGPSDAAAVVDCGFTNVLGRPNCAGGIEIIKGLLNDATRLPVVVVADPDEPGCEGATTLVQSLPNPAIAIVGPSDLRGFLQKQLQKECRRAIIEGLEGDETTVWRPLSHNMSGKFFDFAAAAKGK